MSAVVWGPLAFVGLIAGAFLLAWREQRAYDRWVTSHRESWEASIRARTL